MSGYGEPPTQEEHEEQEVSAMARPSDALRITVEGYEASRLMEVVAGAVREQFRERIDAAVRGAVKAEVARQSHAIEVRVRLEVDAAIEAGWQKTTQWGEPQGPRVTLQERISDELARKRSNGYGKPETTLVEEQVRAAIDQRLASEFAPIFEEAKRRLRDAVDDKLTAAVTNLVKRVAGL